MHRMMAIGFQELVILVVLGLLVAGVIALVVVFRGRAVLWLLIGLAVLAGPVAGLVFYRGAAVPAMRHIISADDELLESLGRIEQQEGASTAAARPSPLPPGEDMSAFLADVYPSAEQAVQAAARDAARSVASVGAPLRQPPGIRVSGSGVPARLLAQAVQGIRQSGSLVGAVDVEAAGPEAPATQPGAAGKILCDVRVDAGQRGAVTVSLRGPENQVSSTAQFRTTEWAADFGHYLSSWGGAQGVMAQSRRPCTSLEEAQRAALDDAAGQLLPAFQQAVTEGMIARTGRAVGPAGSRTNLRQVLMRELERDNTMVVDRFPQRFVRPYGVIWRQTLLMDASPASLAGRAKRICDLAMVQKGAEVASWGRLAMSIGGLAVLVLAVYLVLNAATRGYYALVLRLAAITLVLGGTITVLCMS